MSGVVWTQRPLAEGLLAPLLAAGAPPLLARVLAARGGIAEDLGDPDLAGLIPFDQLKGIDVAAGLLADAIDEGKRLLIVADYDADGATACAVGLRALRAMGAQVDYMVPNRLTLGYGLTPEVVRLALPRQPQLIVTVDNGIASVAGVAEANRLGIPVLVTDHHLPGTQLPDAAAIVNPNQPGCPFPSKCLAGVGVMFYVMMALRAELRRRGRWQHQAEPVLGALLDLVALGTVADVVRLDRNNRLLVQAGLRRIAAGRAVPGIRALYRVAERPESAARSADLGFVLGPRLNAAGRMEGPEAALRLLLAENRAEARPLATLLNRLNSERREEEAQTLKSAMETIARRAYHPEARSLVVEGEGYHPGVVGIVASRLAENYYRPSVVLAVEGDTAKGSARSIAALDLYDALSDCSDLLIHFGGHRAAAGLTLKTARIDEFRECFENAVKKRLGPEDLVPVVRADAEIGPGELTLENVEELSKLAPFGAGNPTPAFFLRGAEVLKRGTMGQSGEHLKLDLAVSGQRVEAVGWSGAARYSFAVPGMKLDVVGQAKVRAYGGRRGIQLALDDARSVTPAA